MLEKIQASVSGLEEKVTAGFSNLEERLGVLESQPVLSAPFNSGCFEETDTEISEETAEDLTTINMEAFRTLHEGDHAPTASPVCMPALQPTSAAQKVGEELIGSCVTPSKIKRVQLILEKERERHLCTLKLLPYFSA